MIKPVIGVVAGLLLSVSAIPLQAERLSDASIEHYIDNHQTRCGAKLDQQLHNAGYSLPFGFTDNFCMCMGKAIFGSMTVAQEAQLKTLGGRDLPESVVIRQAKVHQECTESTTKMYAAESSESLN
ncbi:MAG: hypothetical protein AAGC91_07960 [Pseudomonadota bacterium]